MVILIEEGTLVSLKHCSFNYVITLLRVERFPPSSNLFRTLTASYMEFHRVTFGTRSIHLISFLIASAAGVLRLCKLNRLWV